MKAKIEVTHVLRSAWEEITLSGRFNTWQLRTMDALARCRKASLGRHIDQCTCCNHIRVSYNSYCNRHCPKCQTNEREKWIAAREKDILPVKYFHVVFTRPSELNPLCVAYPKLMYDALFEAAWRTIEVFSSDSKHLGAQTGMFAILHTWGQNLSLRPHLHCVVPSGGFTREGRWKDTKNHSTFLFPVKAMSTVFRAKYMACIRDRFERYQFDALQRTLRDTLFSKSWVVYAKRPFGAPEQVFEYLGRYTHKIAISNHRLKGIDEKQVIFSYKDYKQSGKKKMMTLDKMEFIRRFSLHILPKRFVRIRHCGVLSSTAKRGKFEQVKQALKDRVKGRKKKPVTEMKIHNSNVCSICKKESMIRILDFGHRGPPAAVLLALSKQSKKVNENTNFKKTA